MPDLRRDEAAAHGECIVTKRKILAAFLGGPCDGEWREIEPCGDRYQVPEVPQLLPLRRTSPIPHASWPKHDTYVLHATLRSQRIDFCWVMRHESWSAEEAEQRMPGLKRHPRALQAAASGTPSNTL